MGYANEFQVYVGRPAGQKYKKVILTLTGKLAGINNHDYFDRYFNSVDLHQELLNRKLLGCGTVKRMVKLKGLPKQMSKRKPKKGEAPVRELSTLENQNSGSV